LLQVFEKDIPGSGKLFVLNILSPDDMKMHDLVKNHYQIIDPRHFMKGFLTQIGGNDVVVARVTMSNSVQIKEFMESPEAKRIDFFILPSYNSKEYLTNDEKKLTDRPYGWEPTKEPPAKPPVEQPKQPSAQGPVGPPVNPEYAFDDNGGSRSDGDNKQKPEEPSANQGGDKTTDSDSQPATPSKDSESQGIINIQSLDENNRPSQTVPQPKNPLPPPDIDLSVKDRQYMEMTNKYRVIPEVNGAEGMREVYFKRGRNGQRIIRVSDIIMYENTPEVPEIKKMVDETEEASNDMRSRTVLIRTVNNYPNMIMYRKTNPYTGPEACKECHQISYDKWKSSVHATALDGLKKKKKQKDETCLKCHQTEWIQPTNYNEWTFDKFAPELGCESCHGPGQAHIEMINYVMDEKYRKYWEDIKSQVPYLVTEGPLSKNTCLKCHDKANSPDFDFVKYWEIIAHDEPDVKELPQPKPKTETPGLVNQGPQIPGHQQVIPSQPQKPKTDEKSGGKGKADSGNKSRGK
jgi:hypothetical protein